MWGQIAAAVAPALIGGLFGGDDEKSSGGSNYNFKGYSGADDYTGFEESEFNEYEGFERYGGDSQIDYEKPEYLENTIGEWESGAEGYEGDLTTDQSSLYDQMVGNVSSQLGGENLGMSDEEMSSYMGQVRGSLADQRERGVDQTFSNLNNRGILSSSMTSKGVADVNEGVSDALATAQSNMFLQNENIKRNQYNTAMNQGMGLDQMGTRLSQQNKQNEYNQYLNEAQRQDQYLGNLANMGQWESQFGTNLQQQNISNDMNKYQMNENLAQNAFNMNERYRQSANQFNEQLGLNIFNTNEDRQMRQFQMNEGFRQNAAGIGQQQQQIENRRRNERITSIGTGFTMGSELGEDTSYGSGWGGAIGGLLGGIFG